MAAEKKTQEDVVENKIEYRSTTVPLAKRDEYVGPEEGDVEFKKFGDKLAAAMTELASANEQISLMHMVPDRGMVIISMVSRERRTPTLGELLKEYVGKQADMSPEERRIDLRVVEMMNGWIDERMKDGPLPNVQLVEAIDRRLRAQLNGEAPEAIQTFIKQLEGYYERHEASCTTDNCAKGRDLQLFIAQAKKYVSDRLQ